MNPEIREAFERELRHINEMGGEFVREKPKIGIRLGRGEKDVEFSDPYVERLLEGFAYLAARIQLRLDSKFPDFTEHLLQVVYPHYLAPTPSMAMVQLQPDLAQGALANGYAVKRETALRSTLRKGDRTPQCEFRTKHDVTLWPLDIKDCEYSSYLPDLGLETVPDGARAAIRLRLKITANLVASKVQIDKLPIFIRGSGEISMKLYEQLLGNAVGLGVRAASGGACEYIDKKHISRVGFSDEESILPYGSRSFQGYRLLHEYFAFPDRFLSVELSDLRRGFQNCEESEIDLIVFLDRIDTVLEKALKPLNFALHCTPAANLFPRRTRFRIDKYRKEHRIRTGLTDAAHYEIYQVNDVLGHKSLDDQGQSFSSFYSSADLATTSGAGAYYTLRREPRKMSARELASGWRSKAYRGGSELYIQLTDPKSAPYSQEIEELTVNALCTNRDLPFVIPIGEGRTDFTTELAAPINSIRCLSGPTRPKPSHAHGDVAWRLISHLSLNYLSLVDHDSRSDDRKIRGQKGAAAMRELLGLYGHYAKSSIHSESVYEEESAIRRQIDGILSVRSESKVQRLPTSGPISFGPVLEVTVEVDESQFKSAGAFLLGAVLAEFFAKYVSINTFTETIIRSPERGEVMRWPAKRGKRPSL